DPANACGALDDGIKNRLHVGRRAADDAEHLGRCSLMLQRLPQFCIALPNSLNSLTFSIAITAWSAKILRSAICFSVNGWTSVRRITIEPIARPSRSKGAASVVRIPSRLATALDTGNSVAATANKSLI